LLLASGALLAGVVRGRADERHRALGLFFFLGAMASLALALGLGRYGFEPRYITLSVPVMCCVYFVWQLYGPPRARVPVQAALPAAPCLALWPNTEFATAYATDLRSRLGEFEREMESGVPCHVLIRRHAPYLHIHQEVLVDYLPLL